MQDIYIDSVHGKNVRCHDEIFMDFPTGFTVITGKNGAGKSTIFKSVSLCLFGHDGGKIGERLTVSDMINEKVEKDMELILKFRIVENDVTDRYEIKLYYQHKKFKNAFYLYKNDVDISGETKTATYEAIESLILPSSVWHNTVYFSQQIKDFFTALTNAEQKDIFDNILSMLIYDQYHKNTDTKLKFVMGLFDSVVKEMTIALNQKNEKTVSLREIEQTKRDLEIKHSNQIVDLKNHKIRLENELQLIQTELSEFNFDDSELDKSMTQLSEMQAKLNSIYQLQSQEKKSIEDNCENQIVISTSEIESRSAKLISDLEKEKNERVSSLKNRRLEISRELASISSKYDTSKIEKEINSYKRDKQIDLDSLNSSIRELDVLYPTKTIELQKEARSKFFSEAFNDFKLKAEELRSSAKLVQQDIAVLNKSIDEDQSSLNQDVSTCSKCHRPFTDEASIQVIKDQIEKNKSLIDEHNHKIEQLKVEMLKIKASNDEFVIQRDKEIKEFDESISSIIDKRNQRSSELNHKISLMRLEIDEYVNGLNDTISQNIENCKNESQSLMSEDSEIVRKISKEDKDCDDIKYKINDQCQKECNVITHEHKLNCNTLLEQLEEKYKASKIELDASIEKIKIDRISLKEKRNHQQELNNSLSFKSSELMVISKQLNDSAEFSFDDTSIKRINSEIELIDSNIQRLTTRKNELEVDVKILEFWKQAFSDSGIKSMLIDTAIPFMNENVSDCLEMVAPGTFTVTFDTLKSTKNGEFRDKFNVNIKHNIKGTTGHKKLSGGEKRLVDIACMYSLRGLTEQLYGKRIHNVFYDEVLDALDEDTAAIFCQVSKLMSRERNISLITHKLADHIEPDRAFNL